MGGKDDRVDQKLPEFNLHIMTQANGIIQQQPAPKDGQSMQAWRALSQYLPTRNPDSDYWWRLTGRHLAAIVEAAGYPIEKQYEALLFHYHWTVSRASIVRSGSL
jgi:hypothetical protein